MNKRQRKKRAKQIQLLCNSILDSYNWQEIQQDIWFNQMIFGSCLTKIEWDDIEKKVDIKILSPLDLDFDKISK